VSLTPGDVLVFDYAITQQTCPNPSCETNFGKPYRIDLYIDAPGQQSGVQGIPTISGPAGCTTAGGGGGFVAQCNVTGRDQNNPADTLPMSGSIKVRVAKVFRGATADIVAYGYKLNTYNDGMAVPTLNCVTEQLAVTYAKQRFKRQEKQFALARHRLIQSEHAGFLRLLGLLTAEQHDELIREFHQEGLVLGAVAVELAQARTALDKCKGGSSAPRAAPSVRPAAAVPSVTAGGCTDAQWRPLLQRAAKLTLPRLTPTVRKYVAARKAGDRAAAARYRAQARARFTAEVRRVVAFETLVHRTCS
jgi:hypothetical protein